MKKAENFCKKLGLTRVMLSAQLTALSFYRSLGYKEHGEVYLDANIEHKDMTKLLK